MERSQAKKLGLSKYHTGQMCKHGHIDTRYTKTGECLSCSRIKIRRWQIANPELHRANHQKWRLSHKEKVKASLKRQYERNPGKYKLAARSYDLRLKRASIKLSTEHQIHMLTIYRECPKGHDIDHVVPLNGKTVCGLYRRWYDPTHTKRHLIDDRWNVEPQLSS